MRACRIAAAVIVVAEVDVIIIATAAAEIVSGGGWHRPKIIVRVCTNIVDSTAITVATTIGTSRSNGSEEVIVVAGAVSIVLVVAIAVDVVIDEHDGT